MRHWIPPLVTEKMALSTARIHRVRGRPPLLAAGIKSLIHSHSSSVRSLGYIFSFIYPFYTTCKDFSDRLSCLFFLCFHLDLTTETLWEGPQCLPLRPKAWALLRYLVENPQRLISQAELLAAIWQREYVSDGLLRGSIRELHRVLH